MTNTIPNSTSLTGTLMSNTSTSGITTLTGTLMSDNSTILTGKLMGDNSTTLTGKLMTNLIRGYSAYEVAVREGGFEGTVEEWLASLIGESVTITVIEDTENVYILEFSVGDEVVRTPNLRGGLDTVRQQIGDIQTDLTTLNTMFNTYVDSTDADLDQLSEIVEYIKGMTPIEIVDELPNPEAADPKKIYILRSSENEGVGG